MVTDASFDMEMKAFDLKESEACERNAVG